MCEHHSDHPAAEDVQRHSCAHLLAAALRRLRPGARFGVGPATADGFYYDVEVSPPLGEADLPALEAEMRALAAEALPFQREERTLEEAIAAVAAADQPYKVELLELLRERGSTAVARASGDAAAVAEDVEWVSLYRLGDFVDLCRGPHVAHAGLTGHFKLIRLAGAYWRGDERNPQLQRIYGLCFGSAAALEERLWQIEQARLRDHRRLGRQLGLFAFADEVGAGLPLWLPHGVALRQELECLARDEERREGYQPVVTPHIARAALYRRSGHLAHYGEDMYPPLDIDGEAFYLKPMNCPHHHQVYAAAPRSYRELPLRLSEYGQVYRYEQSGALAGLMRVRGFCQNDAHLYCRADQAQAEFLRVLQLHARYYELFGIRDYWMRLSLPDLDRLDKYVDQPQQWRRALEIIRAALAESGYRYQEVEGEAAFYGPKVDFMIRSAIGTEYAISTNQLDFLAAQNFGLDYVGEDGGRHPVYVIHRAPLGSHERFVAFLIEHYAGAFPFWLAPVQLRILTVADRHRDYAEHVLAELLALPVRNGSGGLRAELDRSTERLPKQIRRAAEDKLPYLLVVGDREVEQGTVAVRRRGGEDLGALPLAVLLPRLRAEAEQRRAE